MISIPITGSMTSNDIIVNRTDSTVASHDLSVLGQDITLPMVALIAEVGKLASIVSALQNRLDDSDRRLHNVGVASRPPAAPPFSIGMPWSIPQTTFGLPPQTGVSIHPASAVPSFAQPTSAVPSFFPPITSQYVAGFHTPQTIVATQAA